MMGLKEDIAAGKLTKLAESGVTIEQIKALHKIPLEWLTSVRKATDPPVVEKYQLNTTELVRMHEKAEREAGRQAAIDRLILADGDNNMLSRIFGLGCEGSANRRRQLGYVKRVGRSSVNHDRPIVKRSSMVDRLVDELRCRDAERRSDAGVKSDACIAAAKSLGIPVNEFYREIRKAEEAGDFCFCLV